MLNYIFLVKFWPGPKVCDEDAVATAGFEDFGACTNACPTDTDFCACRAPTSMTYPVTRGWQVCRPAGAIRSSGGAVRARHAAYLKSLCFLSSRQSSAQSVQGRPFGRASEQVVHHVREALMGFKGSTGCLASDSCHIVSSTVARRLEDMPVKISSRLADLESWRVLKASNRKANKDVHL